VLAALKVGSSAKGGGNEGFWSFGGSWLLVVLMVSLTRLGGEGCWLGKIATLMVTTTTTETMVKVKRKMVHKVVVKRRDEECDSSGERKRIRYIIIELFHTFFFYIWLIELGLIIKFEETLREGLF